MPRDKYRGYSSAAVGTALMKVRQKHLSTKAASKLYGIPRTTLIDKLKGRVADISHSGPNSVLSVEEEETLSQWILDMGKNGFPITKLQLKLEVKRILDKEGRSTPFTNNMPGRLNHYLIANTLPLAGSQNGS